jgi:hypothetical protein
LAIFPNPFQRRTKRPSGIDAEFVAAAALLGAVLVLGLATAADYGFTVDEFNTDDYGPKALAWYTSGFVDRSHFETVEFSLWYYGPWFQMLTAYVQSFDFADRITVRHAITFLVGLGGVAALLPLGRLAGGRWVGLAAIALCLLTGYVYGSLFFTPIDVPFLAAMTWATLAIVLMARRVLPSWGATIAAGLLSGLAIATRTGGVITHVYLLAALLLCAVEVFAKEGRLAPRYLLGLGARYSAAVALAWAFAIALWPWLQIGNPLAQFKIALVHFATISTSFEFAHWGEQVSTGALPRSYIPAQLLVRLPEAFLVLLAVACLHAIVAAARLAREAVAKSRSERGAGMRAVILTLARERAMLTVALAVVLPLGFLILQRATMYDGVRHVLFVIPILAVVAGLGWRTLLPLLMRAPVVSALVVGAYVGGVIATLTTLHPLEYVAMNAFAGGTRGAYDKFELDYWSAAATKALRRLEQRLDYDPSIRTAETPPRILVCIGTREERAHILLRRPWIVETDPDKADFVIATQRWRCAGNKPVSLIDEVRRFDRTFAWTYARRAD